MASVNAILQALGALTLLTTLTNADSLPLNVTATTGKSPLQTANKTSTSVPPTSTGVNDLLASALASAYANAGPGGHQSNGNQNQKGAPAPYSPPFDGAAWAAQQPAARGGSPPPGYGEQRPNFRDYPRPNMQTALFGKVKGEGDDSIYRCYQSHLDYSSMSHSYIQNATGTRVMSTKTLPSSTMMTMYSNASIPTATSCDGWPRVLGQTVTPVTLTFADASMLSISEAFPGPAPTCTIPDMQCNLAYSAFETSTFSYMSAAYFDFFANRKTGLPPNINFASLEPPCDYVSNCPTPAPTVSCSIRARAATVFYWPTKTTGPACARGSGTTLVQPTATIAGKPNTAMYKNFTVTSPSALMILHSMAASATISDTSKTIPEWERAYTPEPIYTQCGHRVDTTLQILPEQISSLRPSFSPTVIDRFYTRYATSRIPYPFDFVDLNPGAVPWDAYAAAKGCNQQTRSDPACPKTILDDYEPHLALPKAATAAGLASDFSGCSAGFVDRAVYVPITASVVEVPSTTNYGAMVTVGPRFSSLKPAALVRIMTAEATAAPAV